ncbi:hypothetical protein [Hyphomicrobium sp.]|uniref:hypothetical protein n=1 Tax=Hyphomicrobium sp. TaxID=82 RepID=UPI0025C3EFF2|nr:hypothetical protein [Hyphomicrobium sp.]MCC7251349.1 hypothetical protein [Hyphomicrobium sp.]
MIGIVAAGILAAAAIELEGLPATIVLLAPFVALLILIVWMRPWSRPKAPRQKAEALRAIPAADVPLPVAEKAEPVDWAGRIATAEAARDHGALAGHFLAFARAEIAEGRTEQAAGYLRSSVRAAAKARDAAVQAEARFELAEIARAAGDLTTACEHWQMARALFHEQKSEARLGETERLMRQHGCPTDWVLNDF